MADVFLSYAREDQAAAAQVARGLEALGLQVFWDTEIPPGQTWADYIESKLAQCRAVVVLWSAHSTKSQWVREEARMGRDRARLIPALLDSSPAPFGFGEVQAANLSTWRGETNHPDWMRFSQAIYGAVRDGAQAPPQPAAPSTPFRPLAPPPAGPSYVASEGVEALSPIGYIQKCFRLYVNGKGRARRAEYWWFTLFSFVLYIIAYVIDAAAFGFNTYTSQPNQQLVYILVALGLLAPTISVLSRRFHDVGLNGWLVAGAVALYLIGTVMMAAAMPIGAPIVGATALAVIVVCIIPSKPGDNQYGPNPKGQ